VKVRIAGCPTGGILLVPWSIVSTSSCYGIYVSISTPRTARAILASSLAVLALVACSGTSSQGAATPKPVATTAASTTYWKPDSGERHLRNIRQLTFGGNNAESYFSRDNKQLIFQRQEKVDAGCDQQ
jgi:hypothetical protein